MTRTCSGCVWLLAVTMGLACSSGSSPAKGCTTDADCGAGARCWDGACQPSVVVAITAPAEVISYARGTVRIEVEVSGPGAGMVQQVELFKKPLSIAGEPEVSLVKLGRPFQLDWDIAQETDGAYSIVARVPAGSRFHESASRTVILDRVRPAGPAVSELRSPTNAQPVPMTGTAEPGALVTVHEGAAVVAQGRAGVAGAWSIGLELGPGRHELTLGATDLAGNDTAEDARTVVAVEVDRDPPVISSRIPAPGQRNVWSRDPITVTFSEPMSDPPAGSVTLVGSVGCDLKPSLSLSPDGTVLTVVPAQLPPVENTLTLTVTSDLTDRAGNRLSLPTSPSSWAWHLPAWQELGTGIGIGTAGEPTMVLAADERGSPMFGAISLLGFAGPWRWTGAEWLWTDPPLSHTEQVALAFGRGGVPFVAASTGGHVVASRYVEGAWGPLAHLNIDPAADTAVFPTMRTDPQGRVVVAWSEASSGHVKRWDGSTWEQVGTGIGLGMAGRMQLSFSASGDVTVTTGDDATGWSSQTWSGTRWYPAASCRPPGGVVADRASAIHRLSPDREGFIALKTSATPSLLQVYLCREDGFGTHLLGGVPLNRTGNGVQSFAMELTSDGMPVIAWSEGTGWLGASVHASRWTGADWEQLGGDLAPELGLAFGAWLALDPNDGVVVLIDDAFPSDSYQAHVKRYNR